MSAPGICKAACLLVLEKATSTLGLTTSVQAYRTNFSNIPLARMLFPPITPRALFWLGIRRHDIWGFRFVFKVKAEHLNLFAFSTKTLGNPVIQDAQEWLEVWRAEQWKLDARLVSEPILAPSDQAYHLPGS